MLQNDSFDYNYTTLSFIVYISWIYNFKFPGLRSWTYYYPPCSSTCFWWSHPAAAAAAKSLQSCPTLCDPRDSSPQGSPVLGILQARTLEWVAISFSNAWKWEGNVKSLSRVWLLATPWTAAHQAPLSMGFSRQEYWSGVPLASPWSHFRRMQRKLYYWLLS